MAETSRTSVIAASGVRPPAHGFERTRRNADRAPTLAIMPGPANDSPSGADGGTSDSDQTRTGEGRSHAVTTGPSRRAVLLNEGDGWSHHHFVERDGMRFAGIHLIVDLWHATRLNDLPHVEQALRDATERAGATLLNIDLHHFMPTGGISGVAVLAESHISIHTWPELSYAAVDVFMCGTAQPHRAIEVLRGAFLPGLLTIAEHKRGVIL